MTHKRYAAVNVNDEVLESPDLVKLYLGKLLSAVVDEVSGGRATVEAPEVRIEDGQAQLVVEWTHA